MGLAAVRDCTYGRVMATWADVERIAGSLPMVEERSEGGFDGWRTWKITGAKGRGVVWERPMRPSDLRDLGDAAPEGESIALRVPDMETKAARLAELPACFDIPHFARFTGLLVLLEQVDVEDLTELIEESWMTVAPKRAVKEWLAERDA
jgi:hypothetical protein